MTPLRLYITNPSDRDAVVAILARNGYTVRIGKEKNGRSTSYKWFVEYWRNDVGS